MEQKCLLAEAAVGALDQNLSQAGAQQVVKRGDR